MAKLPNFTFSKNVAPSGDLVVIVVTTDMKLPSLVSAAPIAKLIESAIEIEKFSGKSGKSLSVVSPQGAPSKVILLGCGDPDTNCEHDWLKIGGKLFAAAGKAEKLSVITQLPDEAGGLKPEQVATIAAGVRLAAYQFDDYLTKGREADKRRTTTLRVIMGTQLIAATKRAWERMKGITDGVLLARQLVNEPANMLGPVEFVRQACKLKALGIKVEVLGEPEMKKLEMNALLGVGQGSSRASRMVIMRWEGGKKGEKPLAFVGKGVVFDTGGISIKPSGGMEDMKGDMGGAAAVTGLMHALAARKAAANVIGIIGLVENMPDGKAQRPGDIVKSMSGQTIEIINTDAEGRLVLADALWYCQKYFKPKFMINLATLTGAVLVALGREYAGIFSNNDELADNLYKAGLLTEEKVWRLPLHEEYDKMIDTSNADMKNTGGRFAGSITAAQFLQRFVNDVPWVHIDVAGTAMASIRNNYNRSWASGYGVRLLDRMVSEFYE